MPDAAAGDHPAFAINYDVAPLLAILAGIAVSLVCALVLSVVTLRLRGLYLALAGFVTSRRVAIATVGVFAVLGFVQVRFWHDTITLVNHTAWVTDDNAFVHFVLGDALVDHVAQALAPRLRCESEARFADPAHRFREAYAEGVGPE